MALKNLMLRLHSRVIDTPETPEKNMRYQRKVSVHAGCSPDTPDTSRFVNAGAVAQIGQFGNAVDDQPSAELPFPKNLRKPRFSPVSHSANLEQENFIKPAMPMEVHHRVEVSGLVAVDPIKAPITPQPTEFSDTSFTAFSNAPAVWSDPDCWCWPHSSAMTGREIDIMVDRTILFNRRGLTALGSELLADKLITRDRESDDRRLCLECVHLKGHREETLRCTNWQQAGLAMWAKDAQLSGAMIWQLQRCDGFAEQRQK